MFNFGKAPLEILDESIDTKPTDEASVSQMAGAIKKSQADVDAGNGSGDDKEADESKTTVGNDERVTLLEHLGEMATLSSVFEQPIIPAPLQVRLASKKMVNRSAGRATTRVYLCNRDDHQIDIDDLAERAMLTIERPKKIKVLPFSY